MEWKCFTSRCYKSSKLESSALSVIDYADTEGDMLINNPEKCGYFSDYLSWRITEILLLAAEDSSDEFDCTE